MENASRSRRRTVTILLAVLLGSLVLKLAFALNVDPLPPRNDERAYLELAAGILQKGRYGSLFRPPGFPSFVAAVVKLGGSVETIRVAQSVLSTLTALLVFLVLRAHESRRVALFATALVAFDPVLIAFSHLLWTETLFLFLLWCMLALMLIPGIARGPSLRWFLAGLFLGAAGLTRAVILTAAPIVVGWMIWKASRTQTVSSSYRPTILAMALFALGACVVVFPWSIRNYRTVGDFILVDTNGAYNLLIGTNPHAMFHDKDDTWSPHWAMLDESRYGEVSRRNPGDAQRRAILLGSRHVLENPVRYLGAVVFEGAHLWTLDNFPLRHLRNGWYGPQSPSWALPLLTISSALVGMLVLGGGTIGLLLHPPGSLRAIFSIFVLHSAVFHALLFSLSRFQVPLRPFLAVGAAWLILHRQEAKEQLWRDGKPTRDGWIAGAMIVVLATVWLVELPLFWDMLTNGGAEHRFVRRLDGP